MNPLSRVGRDTGRLTDRGDLVDVTGTTCTGPAACTGPTANTNGWFIDYGISHGIIGQQINFSFACLLKRRLIELGAHAFDHHRKGPAVSVRRWAMDHAPDFRKVTELMFAGTDRRPKPYEGVPAFIGAPLRLRTPITRNAISFTCG